MPTRHKHLKTVAGIKSSPNSTFDFRTGFAPNFFDVNSLARFGK